MFLIRIANKSLFSHNLIYSNYIKHKLVSFKVLKFVKKEMFSYYVRWILLLIFMNLYNIKIRINFLISHLYVSFFNSKKLVSYIININLSSTNSIVNINNIKGNPKFFYSAGMFGLQKKQKVRQPKAIILILRSLLLKSKILKIKPAAIHFNNLFFNYQSFIFKKLKQKVFIKLVTSYTYQPHNGCRLKKKKRIKIRTRTRKL